jgi:hypothetical protein
MRKLLLVELPRPIGIEFLEDLLELCLAYTCQYMPSGRESAGIHTRDVSVMGRSSKPTEVAAHACKLLESDASAVILIRGFPHAVVYFGPQLHTMNR